MSNNRMRSSLRWRFGKRRTLFVLLALSLALGASLVIVGLGSAGHARSRVVSPPTEAQIAQLRQLALATASRNGDAHPTNGSLIATTRKAINHLANGTDVGSDEDVYAITMHGDFVDEYARVPSGSKLPRGHEIVVVVDAKTLRPVDFILSEGDIHAENAGQSQPLDIQSR
jgi:hypothetical protein